MKQKITEYNYGTLTRNVQLLIDESFAEKVIPASDSVRLLDQIVEEMDLSPLERAIKRTGHKHRTDPVTMLKIILYGAMERITTPQGIPLRMNRSIQSEGAFGILKWDYGFQRFLHRGNKKVFTEILLLAMAQNIQKYHNKIQQNRTGIQLHTKLLV